MCVLFRYCKYMLQRTLVFLWQIRHCQALEQSQINDKQKGVGWMPAKQTCLFFLKILHWQAFEMLN